MRKPLNCPYCVVVLETFEFFFSDTSQLKKKQTGVRKTRDLFRLRS